MHAVMKTEDRTSFANSPLGLSVTQGPQLNISAGPKCFETVPLKTLMPNFKLLMQSALSCSSYNHTLSEHFVAT